MLVIVRMAFNSNGHRGDSHFNGKTTVQISVQSFRSISLRFLEMLVVVFLVLAFFMIFLRQLDALFPTAPGFRSLIGSQSIFSSFGGGDGAAALKIDIGGEFSDMDDSGKLTAVLSKAKRGVKSKRARGIAWNEANKGMKLYEKDAVQTFDNASARVEFDDSNHIDIGENSLVVIRRFEKDLFRNNKSALFLMVEGELNGRLDATEETVNIQIATPSAVARILPVQGDGTETNFKITVNPDQSSTVAVYSGVAEIRSHGEVVLIEENQVVNIKIDEPPSEIEELPDPPEITMPAIAKTYYYRDLPPKIMFAWEPTDPAEKFRFLLARDQDFSDIVSDERLNQTNFSHGNLKNGKYYWRVSSMVGWSESRFSKTGLVKIVQDKQEPMLRVNFPSTKADHEKYTVTGQTEREASIFVAGSPVKIASNGHFNHTVQLKRGSNVIVVEAIDRAGNISYETQVVNGKF